MLALDDSYVWLRLRRLVTLVFLGAVYKYTYLLTYNAPSWYQARWVADSSMHVDRQLEASVAKAAVRTCSNACVV